MDRPEPYATPPVGVGRLPLEVDGIRVVALSERSQFLIAPFRGSEEKLNDLLGETFGVTLPGTLGASASKDYGLLWFKAGTYLLNGPVRINEAAFEKVQRVAAVTDVTEAFVGCYVTGDRAADFLSTQLAFDLETLPEETAVSAEFLGIGVHMYRGSTGFTLRFERSLSEEAFARLEKSLGLFSRRLAFAAGEVTGAAEAERSEERTE